MGIMQQMFASFPTTSGAPGPTTDSLFEYVSLLLSVNSVPFSADASTSNLSITPSGVVRNDIFTPFGTDGNYSVLFNGSTDALTTPATAGFGPNDFTVEAWIYVSAFAIMDIWSNTANSGTTGIQVYVTAAGKLASASAGATLYTGLTTLPLNAWTHVALTRTGGNMKGWINGTLDTTIANSINFSDARPMTIGKVASIQYFNGYISNLRVLNGTALYTSNFTPSTTPLTAITNTILLACQSSGFKDNSINAFTLTVNGTPKVQSSIPFTYSNTYGSAYFNGTSDALTTPTTTGFGTNDFTVEAWIYVPSFSTTMTIWSNTAGSGASGIQVYVPTTGKLSMATFTTSLYTGLTTLPLNAWTHVALTRTAGNIRGWINGVIDTIAADSTNFTDAQPMRIGRLTTTGQYFNGYISNLRIVNGTAVYTSAFTPPTAPLTAITNTTLLTLQNQLPANNVGFIDSSANDYVLTRTGTPQQGTFSPFSTTGWSGYFNGSTDALTTPATAGFGTNDFTVEAWIYIPSYNDMTIWCNSATTGTTGCVLELSITGVMIVYNATTALYIGTATIPLNTWTHVAVTRTGGNIKGWINGVLDNTAANATNFTDVQPMHVGRFVNALYFKGYISNLRVVNGTAVYTSNFTPSTTPLTAIGNTLLLTLQNNRFKDNSALPFALTVSGAPAIQAISPFLPSAAYSPATNGGSTYFNGTTDYITGVTAPTMAVGSASFTVECWVYPTAFTNAIGTIMCIQGGASTTDLNIWVNTSGTLAVGTLANMSLHTGGNLVKNAWSHIAMSVNSGGTATMYVNGVQDGTTWTTSTVTSTIPRLGTGSTIARYFTGFISSARIVKGVQVYTGAFTPPTAPLTATANTVLLFNSTNAGVIDYSGRNDVSTIGSNTISPSLVKYGTGSLMFNGTTDYIRIRNTPAVDLSVGNWTLEMWVYKTQNNGNSSRLWNPDGDSYDAMVLSLNATGGVAIQATTASGSWNVINTTFGSTLNNSQWYHIAVVRSGTDLYGFFNGAKTVLTTSCPTTLYNSVAANKVIGGQSGVARMLYGSINDFRVTKGVARYTANFTPPTTSLPLY